MTALLDPRAADKLARICGLFSSDHDGERASAAAMADKMIRAYGLTWRDVIAAPVISEPTIEDQIDFALHHGEDVLNAWEEGFLHGIRGRQFLAKKQLSKLANIVGKCRAYRDGGGR